MPDLLLHPMTQTYMQAYMVQPSHALLLAGQAGVGKLSFAKKVAADLLGVTIADLENHPYLRLVSPVDGKSISIESVRELHEFLSRKVPGAGKRVIIIENADKLTTEAQNGLLKTLEEPPLETHIIMTANNEQALLPTIRSRVVRLDVARPTTEQVTAHFIGEGFSQEQVQRANLMSGGLPGLMHALLHEEQDHPLFAAVQTARQIIQQSTFGRLALVDTLAKDKEYSLAVLGLLQQMAHVALLQGKQLTHWQKILTASYQATSELLKSGQPKLVLTNLMLSL